MVILSSSPQIAVSAAASRRTAGRVALLFLLAIGTVLSISTPASARAAKQTETATLVEAGEYQPCGEKCALTITPASAFCFRLGDQYLVGEGSSYLHEKKVEGVEDFSGKQLSIRLSQHFLWIATPDGPTVKIHRGTLYERFQNPGCLAEVHKPILARAEKVHLPARVPPGASAVAGSGQGDYHPLFLWYACAMEPGDTGVVCHRWYKNGDSDGMDFYCPHTVDGQPVTAGFIFDPLVSQDGRLVLKSGALLQHDNRARTNGKLDRPSEACR